MEDLHSNELSGGGSNASTQRYIDVEEIRDGVIVLKNGGLRSVLLISSINFDLKSSEEQDGIIYQYQNFLNSLDFPLQIVISSRRLNIGPYIEFLAGKERKQTNELLRLQISEYKNFIKNLTEVSNIMSKNFYVVVPFAPIENTQGGFFSRIVTLLNPKKALSDKRHMFETYKNQLWQRVDHISAGLSGTGVKAAPLSTEEIIELLYNSYNPSVFTSTLIKDVNEIELA